MIYEIFIVEDKKNFINVLLEQFKNDKEFVFKSIGSSELKDHLLDVPSLILLNEDSIDSNIIDLCQTIRSSEDNSITPIMVVSSNQTDNHLKELLQNEIEYYIRKPIDNDCIFYIIKNIVKLLYRNRGISPLTKLPRKFAYSI